MLFNSIHFLLFFPLIVVIYFSLPHKFRWVVLLISSYYFYMSWKLEYILIIIFSTLVNYVLGLQIYKSKNNSYRKKLLYLGIFANVGLLFVFKYFNFFNESVRELLELFSLPLNPLTLKILLPIGISFYTFQALGYIIDVYRRKIVPEKHLGIFAVYISYFPQLVAGPIERAKNLIPQFYEKHYFDYQRITDGLKLMLWGFFKKVVIADRLAVTVDAVYNNVGDYTGLALIIATIFFAFQIYCDFSGYSDIAIGASQVMGIRLMNNFKRPYFSQSMSEFWKRWHISLSSWFRDYIYIPLGGNRVSVSRLFFNLLIVFLICGLWHGAEWTFVIWGFLHGFYLIFGIFTKKVRHNFVRKIRLNRFPKLYKIIKIVLVFILTDIAWVFFRANSLSDAFYVLINMFRDISFNIPIVFNTHLTWLGLVYCLGIIGFMEVIHLIQTRVQIRFFLSTKPIVLRWSIYFIVIIVILLFGMFDKSTEFIYFQF